MKKELAIIGYGRFGRLAARHLKHDFRISVFDSANIHAERGVRMVPLPEAAAKKIVVLAVPAGNLRPLLRSLAPLLRPGAIVCDVCSVKEQPVRWMKSILPRHAGILGTHPLFGPDSAPRTVSGKGIVLCPVRISRDRLRHISRYLKRRGLTVRQMDARRHDALMASTLFLTQLVGRALIPLIRVPEEKSTSTYRKLSQIVSTAAHDSPELFRDMYRYNRYASRIPVRILRELKKISKKLSSRR